MWVFFRSCVDCLRCVYGRKREERQHQRNWTENEMCIFAEVPDNGFGNGLEMLALKCISNKEMLELIEKCLDTELKYYNNNNEDSKKSKIGLDTSIEKLRLKYRNLKQEWIKKKSVKSAIINPVFCEMNAELKVTSSAKDTSFLAI